jgi:hypothetical protein
MQFQGSSFNFHACALRRPWSPRDALVAIGIVCRLSHLHQPHLQTSGLLLNTTRSAEAAVPSSLTYHTRGTCLWTLVYMSKEFDDFAGFFQFFSSVRSCPQQPFEVHICAYSRFVHVCL